MKRAAGNFDTFDTTAKGPQGIVTRKPALELLKEQLFFLLILPGEASLQESLCVRADSGLVLS